MTITLDELVYDGPYRTIGKRRMSQLGTVSKADMQAVEDAIRVHLGLAK
jgi:hypothetical protein